MELNIDHHPQFTEGPARSVVVNNDSKDSLALLVTETFLTRSRNLNKDSHHISSKQSPLQQGRRDARDAEDSINLVRESLEIMAESQEQADELGEIAQKKESELIEGSPAKE